MPYADPARKREHQQKYYEANRERLREQQREYGRKYRAENKEAIAARTLKWRQSNKDSVAAYNKEYRDANKARSRAYNRERKYGIAGSDWTKMFEEQDRRCAICRSDTPGAKYGWHTDHCHTTGAVRGILCHGCNVALGGFRDNIDVLRLAVVYLEEHTFA